MKKGALIGGIVGFFVGIGSLMVMNFPHFLGYLFLGRIYDIIISNMGDLGEALGWLYFIFSTLVGVLYGVIFVFLIKKLLK